MDEVREAFTTLAFTDDETDSIYRLLSGILLVGNIEFDGQEKVTVKNDDLLEELVELWGVAKGLLKSSLEAREFSAGRGTAYKVPLSATQAIENRDALAKVASCTQSCSLRSGHLLQLIRLDRRKAQQIARGPDEGRVLHRCIRYLRFRNFRDKQPRAVLYQLRQRKAAPTV